MDPLKIVEKFLHHIFAGEMTEALALVAPTAKFIGTRPVRNNPAIPIYGTFDGPDGASQLFGHFASLLEPQEFTVAKAFSADDHVAMYGTLRHRSRHTGRDFVSDWALVCRVNEGQLSHYHFYEDTAALEAAVVGAGN